MSVKQLSIYNEIPVHVLADPLQEVIKAIEATTQAPLALIVSSVFSAIGLACQDMIDVSPKKGLVHPTNLYFVTLADSGERKTAVDELVMRPFRQLEREAEERFNHEYQEYEVEISVSQTEIAANKAAFKKMTIGGEDTTAIKQSLRALEVAKPRPPKRQKWLLKDVTTAAIREALPEFGYSIGVVSDEAGNLLASDFMRETSELNSKWGAKPISAVRANKHVFIEDYRFSLSMMIQRQPFKRFLDRKGAQARESGFFARCLICEPASTQGSRFITPEIGVTEDVVNTALKDFGCRIKELSCNSMERRTAGLPRECLTLSPEASADWLRAFNKIESQIGPLGELREFSDVSSKYMEHVSRLAAVMEYFTTGNLIISLKQLDAAIAIVDWYSNQFVNLFKVDTTPDEIRHANEVERWLEENMFRSTNGLFNKIVIRRYGPNCIRNKDKLDRALDALYRKQVALPYTDGKKSLVQYFPRANRRPIL